MIESLKVPLLVDRQTRHHRLREASARLRRVPMTNVRKSSATQFETVVFATDVSPASYNAGLCAPSVSVHFGTRVANGVTYQPYVHAFGTKRGAPSPTVRFGSRLLPVELECHASTDSLQMPGVLPVPNALASVGPQDRVKCHVRKR